MQGWCPCMWSSRGCNLTCSNRKQFRSGLELGEGAWGRRGNKGAGGNVRSWRVCSLLVVRLASCVCTNVKTLVLCLLLPLLLLLLLPPLSAFHSNSEYFLENDTSEQVKCFRSLLLNVWSMWSETTEVSAGSLLEIQVLRPLPRFTQSQPVFQQDQWLTPTWTCVWEALNEQNISVSGTCPMYHIFSKIST